MVIAEDLGTVELAFRKRFAKVGIAGMDVLWFQRKRTVVSRAGQMAPRCGRNDDHA